MQTPLLLTTLELYENFHKGGLVKIGVSGDVVKKDLQLNKFDDSRSKNSHIRLRVEMKGFQNM